MNPTFKMWGKEIGNHTHDTSRSSNNTKPDNSRFR
jgi:hypothetical protein